MSEYVDNAVQYFIDTRLDVTSPKYRRKKAPSFQKRSGNYKWRNKEGQIINMRQMSYEYLANCIKMCDESGNTAKAEQLREVLAARIAKTKNMEKKMTDFDYVDEEAVWEQKRADVRSALELAPQYEGNNLADAMYSASEMGIFDDISVSTELSEQIWRAVESVRLNGFDDKLIM